MNPGTKRRKSSRATILTSSPHKNTLNKRDSDVTKRGGAQNTKQKRGRKTENKQNSICLVFGDSADEDWIQCKNCKEWAHEECADISDSNVHGRSADCIVSSFYPVPICDDEDTVESENSEDDQPSRDDVVTELCFSPPQQFSQAELNDLALDLGFSKKVTEILPSRLKPQNGQLYPWPTEKFHKASLLSLNVGQSRVTETLHPERVAHP
ncbi:unnamed protein product [Clavelina lepadiformis]|uniref:PHD-type domain-containing protein n=1 Tax=Clavelina lepadiformis TaxID=159417 RepID=A0ABP0FQL5_CLALP